MNKQAILASRPVGMVQKSDFEIRESAVPDAGEGQFRVKVEFISLDPAMRGWLAEGKSYVPPVQIGEVMRALAVGTVDQSNHADFAVGDVVVGRLGVQEYAVSDGKGDVYKVDADLAPKERWIGGLGMPGLTAYFGLLRVGEPKEGDTVVVSAAAGAVGTVVGQLAKLKGARAVGIAGGPEKCAHVVDNLGFDACVDYKADDLAGQLKKAAPDGIDVLFENVGGDVFDTCLAQMNLRGRVVLCGLISAYNATKPMEGPKNIRSVLVNRLKMQGIIVFDWIDEYGTAVADLGQWHKEGKLVLREDVREGGIEAYVDTLNLLYTGGNLGKLVLKV